MKWCNKSKAQRRSNWYTAIAPGISHVKSAHNWCKEYPSEGKFYHHYTNTRWWFEYKDDAAIFNLMFGDIK